MRVYDSQNGIGRELYDLCRRYKFEYKTYQEKRKVNEIYGSKWTADSLQESIDIINTLEDEMIEVALQSIILDGSIALEAESYNGYHNKLTITMNPRFTNIIQNALKNRKTLEMTNELNK